MMQEHALELNSTITAFVLHMEIAQEKMSVVVNMVTLVNYAISHYALMSEVTMHPYVQEMENV